MTDLLRPEILVPARPHLRHMVLVAVGCGALGGAFGLAATQRSHSVVAAPPAKLELVPAMPVAQPAPAALPTAQPVRSRELSLVVSAGGASYMKLAELEADKLPAHDKARLVHEDGIEAAIAIVQDRDVPQPHRRWLGREVTVDNACSTTVTGFAIVARLTGDTGYAGVDDDTWTARNVLESGNVVFAARLAGCTGTFARDAALPAVVVPQELTNDTLASQARAQLITSAAARDTQREYLDMDQTGNWWDAESTQFITKIVKHPTTGVTWVSVHGHMEHGCGEPNANVWGLFRVEADGTLAAVQLRKLGDLESIDQLVDIDGDGELEVIGKPWLGLDTVIMRASGEELDRLTLPLFGCPC